MATEKKPSIYDDRGSSGSSAELDEYGVWVKSEPLDINGNDESGDDLLEISDLTISDLDSSLENLPLLEDDPESELNLLESSPLEGLEPSKDPDIDAKTLPPDAISSDIDALSLYDGVLDIANLSDLPDLEEEDEGEELQVEDILAADPDFMADKDSPLAGLSEDGSASVIEQTAVQEALTPDEEAFLFGTDPVIEEAITHEAGTEESPAEITEAPPKEAAPQKQPPPASGPASGAEFADAFMENFLDESPFDDDDFSYEPAAKAPEAAADGQPAEAAAVAEPVEAAQPVDEPPAEAEIVAEPADFAEAIADEQQPAETEIEPLDFAEAEAVAEPLDFAEAIADEQQPAEADIEPLDFAGAIADEQQPAEAEIEPLDFAGAIADEQQPAETEIEPLDFAETEAVAETAEAELTEAAVGLAADEQPAEAEAVAELAAETAQAAADADAIETAKAVELTKTLDAEIETTDAAETIDGTVEAPAEEQPVIENLEKEAPMPAVEENPPAQAAASNLSTELLLRIAEELSSIRQELSTLKQDFLADKGKKQPEAELPMDDFSEMEATPQTGGFFDDIEDEKIAFSEDELDNIVHSANFIEESGEGVVEDQLLEAVLLDPNKDSDELQRLREEGIELITPMPEDISLLEAAVAEAGFEDTVIEGALEAGIDLSNAVIEEPDLSGKIRENPVQEPELGDISFEDISLDLPIDDDIDISLSDIAVEEQLIEIPQETARVSEAEVVSVGAPAEESAPAVVYEEAVAETAPAAEPAAPPLSADLSAIPSNVKQELKTVLSYMDQLLESLPEDKIEEFAASKYFATYKKLFAELGLV